MLLDIKIQNIVAAFTLEPSFSLEEIKETFRGECFFDTTINNRRYTFRVVAIRTENPRFTFLIYRTGKVVCTGSKNIKYSQKCDKYLLNRFLKVGITTKLKEKAEIQNIVATTTLKDSIDIEKLVTQLQEDKQTRIIYEPEQFPAAIIKLSTDGKGEATILLFSNGKLVCVGLTNLEQVQEAIKKIISEIHKHN